MPTEADSLRRLARSLAAAERSIARGEPDRVERTKEVGEIVAALVPEWKRRGRLTVEAVTILASIDPALHWAHVANQECWDDKQLLEARGDVSAHIESLLD